MKNWLVLQHLNLLKQKLKEQFPAWVNEEQHGKYHLCLSDDIDSLMSCVILKQLFDHNIKFFYSFQDLYAAPRNEQKEVVGVDIAFEKHKAWDNHVCCIDKSDTINPNSANLNSIQKVNQSNYNSKYAGSTLLQIFSYYDVPLPEDREALMVLLTIDVAYKGHFNDYYKNTHNDYFKQMELEPLLDVLNDEQSTDSFIKVMKKYNLNGKIQIKDGKLTTNIKLKELSDLFGFEIALPDLSFYLKRQYNRGSYNMQNSRPLANKPKGLFSFALTRKHIFQYTQSKTN
ncbi:hypothetical protein [Saccharibacillus brassicae]|uniref:Uncharacterized protein n=1 Tax=Saccharibacillus brassicae TaxID=2583377 RepID=A0A4Y6UTX3_SACBS|nr:hypothetical protein [Saccharibacillus brassicae]QDH19787.1 hypothetical protein FFV09_02240 [Saccharibacillus brassicae]